VLTLKNPEDERTCCHANVLVMLTSSCFSGSTSCSDAMDASTFASCCSSSYVRGKQQFQNDLNRYMRHLDQDPVDFLSTVGADQNNNMQRTGYVKQRVIRDIVSCLRFRLEGEHAFLHGRQARVRMHKVFDDLVLPSRLHQ